MFNVPNWVFWFRIRVMAFSTAPTLCEVTYDISEEEKRYTPFRYQCRSAPARQNAASPTGNSEVTNYSLPSGLTVTYYEYLRSLYDSRIQSANVTRKASIVHCGIEVLVRINLELWWGHIFGKSQLPGH